MKKFTGKYLTKFEGYSVDSFCGIYTENEEILFLTYGERQTFVRGLESDFREFTRIVGDFKTHCDYYKNSYFWNGNGNSSDRSRKESRSEFSYDNNFSFMGLDLSLFFKVEMSRNNVYTNKEISINGEIFTQTALNSILKEISKLTEIIEMSNIKIAQ